MARVLQGQKVRHGIKEPPEFCARAQHTARVAKPFWLLGRVQFITDRQLLIYELRFLGTSTPGRIFWAFAPRASRAS